MTVVLVVAQLNYFMLSLTANCKESVPRNTYVVKSLLPYKCMLHSVRHSAKLTEAAAHRARNHMPVPQCMRCYYGVPMHYGLPNTQSTKATILLQNVRVCSVHIFLGLTLTP